MYLIKLFDLNVKFDFNVLTIKKKYFVNNIWKVRFLKQERVKKKKKIVKKKKKIVLFIIKNLNTLLKKDNSNCSIGSKNKLKVLLLFNM